MIRNVAWTILGVSWCVGLFLAFAGMLRNSAISGPAEPTSRTWPKESALQRHAGLPQLVLVAHPHCPCVRASLVELQRLRASRPVPLLVVFVKPRGCPDGWEQTELWREAQALPGTEVYCDRAGCEAKRLGAVTSGQVYAYDAQGRLIYRGGVTPARGHEGRSRGLAELEAALDGGAAVRDSTPVYGCPLF